MRRLLLTLTVLLLLPASAQASWGWPVRGDVITPYRNGDDPYAAGQHRGIDIAAPVGTPVMAAAGGDVRFAGTAGSSGMTVSVRTLDGFDASYLHLSSLAVRAGAHVVAGERLGAVGTSGTRSTVQPHLHFGVREAGTRHAYIDPLSMLPPLTAPPPSEAPRPAPAPAPAPLAPVAAPAPKPAPAPRAAPRPAPTPRFGPRPAPAPRRAPRLAPAPRAAPRPAPAPHGAPRPAPIPLRAPRPHAAPGPAHAPRGAPAPVPALARRGARRSGPLGAPRLAPLGSPSAQARDDAREPGPTLSGEGTASSVRDPTTASSSPPSSGPDLGWTLACAGLLLAAGVLGLTEDGRRATARGRVRVGGTLRSLLDRRGGGYRSLP